MSRTFFVLLAAGVLCLVAAERVRYDNHRVFKVKPQSQAELAVLKKLEESSSRSLIFLDAIHYLGSAINVVVAPHRVEEFSKLVKSANISTELIEENAQSQLEDNELADSNRRSAEYTWEKYHELNDTYNWLHSLADRYPQQASVIKVGSTYEGREMLGIKISYGPGKKAIFIEGGIHAREWISPATVTYITSQLLTSDNPEVRLIAESFDWHIVPHANPDGYAYTTSTDRLWRKTRSKQKGNCFGVDPNRNWDFHWNEVGTSDQPCSDTFAGPDAFSEIETRSLARYIATLKDDLFLYLSFHSYSQLLLFPYGHTSKLPYNYKDLKRVFDAAVAGIARRYGTKYVGGNIYDAIYPASGASVDWAYGVLGTKYSYCYELRPSSKAFWLGFNLPAKLIVPTGEETLDSVVDMIKEAGIKTFF